MSYWSLIELSMGDKSCLDVDIVGFILLGLEGSPLKNNELHTLGMTLAFSRGKMKWTLNNYCLLSLKANLKPDELKSLWIFHYPMQK